MTAERTCERCAAPLEGRRPDTLYCSAACRREAAREREVAERPRTDEPTDNTSTDTARRAHASYGARRRLDDCLDRQAQQPSDADARLMAGVRGDALREGGADR